MIWRNLIYGKIRGRELEKSKGGIFLGLTEGVPLVGFAIPVSSIAV